MSQEEVENQDNEQQNTTSSKLKLDEKLLMQTEQNAWIQIFSLGKLPNRRAYHQSFFYKDNFYIHGGQDLKEGMYSDLWKINLNQITQNNEFFKDIEDGTEINNIQWQKVETTGDIPSKISHHQGVLYQNQFIIYGGIQGLDSNDSIFILNLDSLRWIQIKQNKQEEVNGNLLPAGRDDFLFIIPKNLDTTDIQIYLIGGFKNGQKMNDLYRLTITTNHKCQWELLIQNNNKNYNQPEIRSGFSGACFIDEKEDIQLYIFGGTGDNNNKLNDLWLYNLNGWTKIKYNQLESEIPEKRSGHQCTLYKYRYLLLFGGMQEVTNELNDLYCFDIQQNQWKLLQQDNKNISTCASPQQKSPANSITLKKTFNSNVSQKQYSSKRYNKSFFNKAKQQSFNINTQQSPNTTMYKTNRKSSFKKTRQDSIAKGKHNQLNQINDIGMGLSSPTSITMKNAFIIKNADISFDHYYTQMKKRKGGHSPIKISANQSILEKDMLEQKARILDDKQPPGRDGHSAFLYQGIWIIFGGDRHHMPYNDLYILNINNLLE